MGCFFILIFLFININFFYASFREKIQLMRPDFVLPKKIETINKTKTSNLKSICDACDVSIEETSKEKIMERIKKIISECSGIKKHRKESIRKLSQNTNDD